MSRSIGYLVTSKIEGANPRVPRYPLLPQDLLVKSPDGTYRKECPGIAIGGFRLTPEQEATLEQVEFTVNGLTYQVYREEKNNGSR